jgi:subtilisin family serine protease
MEVSMNIKTCVQAVLVATVIALFTPLDSFGQEGMRSIGRFQYGKFSGMWYTVVQGQKGDLLDTTHIILRLKDRGDVKNFNFKSAGLPVLRDVRGKFAEDFYEVEVPKGAGAFEILRSLDSTREFEDAFFNVLLRIDATPNDPIYSSQWNLPKVSAPNAWDLTTGSSSVIVAVVDVGGDYNHADLAANKWSGTGYNFYDHTSDPYPYDGAGHGTCVAGIIGAVTDNSLGVCGVAGGWNGSGGIRLMHLRAGYRDSNGNEWIDPPSAAQATDSAAAWGAKVINMSFGGTDSSALSALKSAIDRAVNNHGVVVVASAGNYTQGTSTSVMYPAAFVNAIAVGATTESDVRKSLNDGTDETYWGSCYGSQLWITAPGIHVPTTDITGSVGYDPGNYYLRFNGTSAAAPHVSATAALMRSVNPTLTVSQIRTALRYSADKVSSMGGNDWTSEYGYGRINISKAVHYLFVPQVFSTVQSAVNAAAHNQTIYISSGTFNENVTATNISNLTITGAGVNTTTISGTLTFNNCSNLQLWSTFWCWGENLYYINLGNFDSYVAGTSSTTGISLYSCTGFDQSGIVNYCGTGLLASGSSGLVQDGANFISNNTSVAASTGANVQVGDGQAAGPRFCTSVTYDFDSEHRSSINAYQCYYQNGTPRYYTSTGGTVVISGNNSCTGQSMSGPIANMQKKLSSTVQSQSDDPAEAAFSQIDTSYFSLLRTIKDETRKNGLSNNGPLHDQYLGVINDFRIFINNNPQSPLAIVSLTTAANGFGVFGDYDAMKSFLNEIMTDSKLTQLKDAARDLMVDYYRNTNDYDSAIGAADAFVNECKNDSDLVADVMLKKGLILHYNKKMTDNAAACFSTIVNNFPGSAAARFAENELQILEGQAKETAKTTGFAVSRGITLTNYPNPFNPTTTIAYQIPTDGHVTIKVFDILGRDVTTLVDEFKPAGSYTVQFDASRLASGIYFYSIHAGEYTAVKKMLLLK